MKNTSNVVIQIHHFECDVSDDYIKIVTDSDIPKQEVISVFMDALCSTKRRAEATRCRMTWLDMAIEEMRKRYSSASFCKKQAEDTVIDLDWASFEPAEEISNE